MPCEEEAAEVDLASPLDMDNGIVLVLVHCGWELGFVKVGRLAMNAVDGIGVGLAFLWWHAGEADSGRYLVCRAPASPIA